MSGSQQSGEVYKDGVIRIQEKVCTDFGYGLYCSLAYVFEVKSGHNVYLRSLQSFMDLSSGDISIRVRSGSYSIGQVSTVKSFHSFVSLLSFWQCGWLWFVLFLQN